VSERRRNPRKQYKLEQRARLTREPPFTPDILRELIGNALANRYAPPGPAEAQRLCSILNQRHAWFYEVQELREFNTAVDDAAAAIETLQKVLPVIGKHHLAKAEQGDVFSKWMADAAADLHRALNEDPARVTHRDPLPDRVRDWRWLAEVLPVYIDEAMRPANPHFPSGYSKGGPLTRILAAVIPLITGETDITAVAVGNQLILLGKSTRGNRTG
jgi:hypothetical protein